MTADIQVLPLPEQMFFIVQFTVCFDSYRPSSGDFEEYTTGDELHKILVWNLFVNLGAGSDELCTSLRL
jgi:hypothetical protein